MKRCSTLVGLRERHIKMTMRYHLTPEDACNQHGNKCWWRYGESVINGYIFRHSYTVIFPEISASIPSFIFSGMVNVRIEWLFPQIFGKTHHKSI